jgi:hypothetical protein
MFKLWSKLWESAHCYRLSVTISDCTKSLFEDSNFSGFKLSSKIVGFMYFGLIKIYIYILINNSGDWQISMYLLRKYFTVYQHSLNSLGNLA